MTKHNSLQFTFYPGEKCTCSLVHCFGLFGKCNAVRDKWLEMLEWIPNLFLRSYIVERNWCIFPMIKKKEKKKTKENVLHCRGYGFLQTVPWNKQLHYKCIYCVHFEGIGSLGFVYKKLRNFTYTGLGRVFLQAKSSRMWCLLFRMHYQCAELWGSDWPTLQCLCVHAWV